MTIHEMTKPDLQGGDVVDLLLAQHQQVRTLLQQVAAATGDTRQQSFDSLREYLARHETAEEMIIRPLTKSVQGGKEVADEVFHEENESKDVLAKLEKLDVDSPEFATAFENFRNDVLKHAEHEENAEFPLLRQQLDADKLEKAKDALIMAEKTAPTHPHTSAKSNAVNYAVGPFAALLDRARDAIGKAIHH